MILGNSIKTVEKSLTHLNNNKILTTESYKNLFNHKLLNTSQDIFEVHLQCQF